MKFLQNALISFFCILSLMPITHGAFTDIQESQYKPSIEALKARTLIQGYSDNTFRPYQPINRAEFLKIIIGALPIPTPETTNSCFTDVAPTTWYAPYVCAAKNEGIIQGYSDNSFRPSQSINMVEAFSILTKSFHLAVATPSDSEQWYAPLVNLMHNANIFSKYSYLPNKHITREEVAHVLNEVLLHEERKRLLTQKRNSTTAGCGTVAPTTPISSLQVGGETRNVIVHIPSGYNPNTPLSIIFGFHGRTNSNVDVQRYFGLDRAVGNNAITVYPAGKSISARSYQWTTKDFKFFDALYEQLSRQYCINKDEVFVMGHSLGAWMANNLACARGHMIRGVATLGGSMSERGCSGPVAAMIWHNPQDNLVSFAQGVNAKNTFREQTGCGIQETPTEPRTANCVQYDRCGEYSPVLWCPHTLDTYTRGQYTPHTWPRGTGSEMWKFFQKVANESI